MTAIKKEELDRLEKKHGLKPDGLTYQHRCSRITAVMKGEEWIPPEKKEPKRSAKAPEKQTDPDAPTISRFESHPLYGKRILITPMMVPDKDRNLAYPEVLGPQVTVREINAGERLHSSDTLDRMVGDYEVTSVDKTQQTVATTIFPKIGTEISWLLGKELVPVVRGNSGKSGYVWSLPTQVIQIEDSLIQVYGLKTLIQQVFPELLPKFSGKPMMSYIDGVTLAASIPQTEALIREQTRKMVIDERAGINY